MCRFHRPLLRSYAAIAAFNFVVKKINKDPEILPNITLGYHLFDAFGDEMKSLQSVLQILSGVTDEIPNYSCLDHGKVIGFLGYSFDMEQILQIYGYPKVSVTRSRWTMRIYRNRRKEQINMSHHIMNIRIYFQWSKYIYGLRLFHYGHWKGRDS